MSTVSREDFLCLLMSLAEIRSLLLVGEADEALHLLESILLDQEKVH